jgi:hypothetical protein
MFKPKTWICIAVSAFATTFTIALFPLLSADAFMYLAIAEYWLKNGRPETDPFLISPQLHFQIWHEWLSYFVFWTVHKAGGFQALIIFKAILFSLMSLLVVRAAHLFKSQWLVLFMALGLALFGAHYRMSERTSIFSDLFTLICLVLSLQFYLKNESLRSLHLFAVSLLFLFWTNLHPGWLFGFAVLALGCFFRWRNNFQKGLNWMSQEQKRPWLILTAAVVGLFLNPLGLEGVLYPFKFSNEIRQVYSQYYFEWAPIYTQEILHFVEVKIFLLFVAVAVPLLLFRALRRSMSELLFIAALLIFTVLPSFLHSRFVVLSSYSLALLLCFSFRDSKASLKMAGPISLSISLAVTVFFLAWPFRNEASPVALKIDESLLPSTTLEALARLPPGPVFSSHEFGGVLAWKFQGTYPVLFHGFDIDLDRFLNQHMAALNSEAELLRVIEKYQIRYFLMDRHGGAKIIFGFLEKHGWKINSFDQAAVLITL